MIGILAHRRQIVDKEDLFYPIPLAAVEGAYFQGKGGEKRGLLLRETEGRREGTEKEGDGVKMLRRPFIFSALHMLKHNC